MMGYCFCTLHHTSTPTSLQQDEPNFIGGCLCQAVIVEIVLEIAVPATKVQFLEKLTVVHEIKRIEHIETFVRGENQRIAHQLRQRSACGDIVEAVRRFELLVTWVIYNC
eukprot:m.17917 g.17917  ORF g.17917 m.17917 type:complete len:110 (-) comp11336_c0_seq1:1657-1986(-)